MTNCDLCNAPLPDLLPYRPTETFCEDCFNFIIKNSLCRVCGSEKANETNKCICDKCAEKLPF
jgi:hypothetical protein